MFHCSDVLKFKADNLKLNKGFSLLELTLAIGLFMIFAVSLSATAIGGHLNNLDNSKSAKVTALIVESWEAVKSIRNDDWVNIINGTHGLAVSGGQWVFSGTSDVYDGFTRVITVSDVQRDLITGNIVTSGGTVDPDSKQIAFDISWNPTSDQTRSIQFSTYLTNYVNPAPWPPAP